MQTAQIARQRYGPRFMSTLLTTDYLAAEALTICRAVGKADLTVGVTDTRLPDGSHAYYLTVHNYLGAEQTIYQDNAEKLLGGLAAYVGCAFPLAFTTATQHQQLTSLLNHPAFERPEKEAVLLAAPAWATAYAEQRLAELRQEALRRVAAERGFTVVGSAEIIALPAAQAA